MDLPKEEQISAELPKLARISRETWWGGYGLLGRIRDATWRQRETPFPRTEKAGCLGNICDVLCDVDCFV